ncbi:MAG TPA: hypothetical protein VJ020_04140 [Anaerolineales bacterium]|nr:hypothetical protein [Anaerolineales bacterium]
MKSLFVWLVGIGLILTATGCSSASPTTPPPSAEPTLASTATSALTPTPGATAGTLFTSRRFGYSIRYPEGWIEKDRPGEWADFDPLDPNRGAGIDAFAAYLDGRNLALGIGARSLPADSTLDSWIETAKALIKNVANKGVCRETTENDPAPPESILLDGAPAVLLEYQCPARHDNFGLVVLSIHSGQGFWITWLSSQGRRDHDRAQFAQILSTFSFAN